MVTLLQNRRHTVKAGILPYQMLWKASVTEMDEADRLERIYHLVGSRLRVRHVDPVEIIRNRQ